MNRTIILPRKAIQTIVSTDKHVLFLRSFPPHFRPTKDGLIAVESETGKSIGQLRSPQVYKCDKFWKNWWNLRRKIAYKDDSFLSYLFSRRPFFVYVFTDFVRFK